jgi:hypothetical protein
VNLAEGWIEVYREPSPTGYELIRKVQPGKTISPLAFGEASHFADMVVAVSDIIK